MSDDQKTAETIARILHRLWCPQWESEPDLMSACSYGQTDIQIAWQAIDRIREVKG